MDFEKYAGLKYFTLKQAVMLFSYVDECDVVVVNLRNGILHEQEASSNVYYLIWLHEMVEAIRNGTLIAKTEIPRKSLTFNEAIGIAYEGINVTRESLFDYGLLIGYIPPFLKRLIDGVSSEIFIDKDNPWNIEDFNRGATAKLGNIRIRSLSHIDSFMLMHVAILLGGVDSANKDKQVYEAWLNDIVSDVECGELSVAPLVFDKDQSSASFFRWSHENDKELKRTFNFSLKKESNDASVSFPVHFAKVSKRELTRWALKRGIRPAFLFPPADTPVPDVEPSLSQDARVFPSSDKTNQATHTLMNNESNKENTTSQETTQAGNSPWAFLPKGDVDRERVLVICRGAKKMIELRPTECKYNGKWSGEAIASLMIDFSSQWVNGDDYAPTQRTIGEWVRKWLKAEQPDPEKARA